MLCYYYCSESEKSTDKSDMRPKQQQKKREIKQGITLVLLKLHLMKICHTLGRTLWNLINYVAVYALHTDT